MHHNVVAKDKERAMNLDGTAYLAVDAGRLDGIGGCVGSPDLCRMTQGALFATEGSGGLGVVRLDNPGDSIVSILGVAKRPCCQT